MPAPIDAVEAGLVKRILRLQRAGLDDEAGLIERPQTIAPPHLAPVAVAAEEDSACGPVIARQVACIAQAALFMLSYRRAIRVMRWTARIAGAASFAHSLGPPRRESRVLLGEGGLFVFVWGLAIHAR